MVIGTSDGQSYESEMHYHLDIPQLMESKDYDPKTDTYQLEEPKEVHIVRHGETTENEANTVRGWEPVSLNDTGIEEAHKAGKELKDKGVQVIVSSDLQRAKETAKIIKKETGAELQFDPRLRTWDVGEHAGKPCETSNPILAEYAEHKQDEPVPGGESFNDFTNRSFAGIRDAILNNKDKELAILTHNRVEATLKGWEKTGQSNPDIDYKESVKETTEPGSVRSVQFQPNATILQPGPAVPANTFEERFNNKFPGPMDAPINKGDVINWWKQETPLRDIGEKTDIKRQYQGKATTMPFNPNVNKDDLNLYNPVMNDEDPQSYKAGDKLAMEDTILNKIIKEGGTRSGGSAGGSPKTLSLSEYKELSKNINEHITKAVQEGKSYREISDELGLTKNAVIGRANRLDLEYGGKERLPDWFKEEMEQTLDKELMRNPSQQQQGEVFDLTAKRQLQEMQRKQANENKIMPTTIPEGDYAIAKLKNNEGWTVVRKNENGKFVHETNVNKTQQEALNEFYTRNPNMVDKARKPGEQINSTPYEEAVIQRNWEKLIEKSKPTAQDRMNILIGKQRAEEFLKDK